MAPIAWIPPAVTPAAIAPVRSSISQVATLPDRVQVPAMDGTNENSRRKERASQWALELVIFAFISNLSDDETGDWKSYPSVATIMMN